jgi:hypothetical protein
MVSCLRWLRSGASALDHAAAAVSRSGLWDEHTASAFQPRLRGREGGGVEMVLLDALAPGGRLAIFASGLWLFDEQFQGAAGAPIVVHGANTAQTARLSVFVANPLYRADPEREWPALASAMLWADQ